MIIYSKEKINHSPDTLLYWKELYERNGEYRYAVVSLNDERVICCSRTYDSDSAKKSTEFCFQYVEPAKIVDLMYWSDNEKKCNSEKAFIEVTPPQPDMDIFDKSERYDDIKNWLNREIEMAKISMDDYAECFDGVHVDEKTRKELLKSHIRFCENALKILKD